MQPRWEDDERGRGVADAASEIPDLDRLREAMAATDWVAEEPELHLLPHVESLCAERGWRVVGATTDGPILDVEVAAPAASRRALREVAFALVGSFAELSTHVVEVGQSDLTVLEARVTTGMLGGEGPFAPHGHVVRLRVHAA